MPLLLRPPAGTRTFQERERLESAGHEETHDSVNLGHSSSSSPQANSTNDQGQAVARRGLEKRRNG